MQRVFYALPNELFAGLKGSFDMSISIRGRKDEILSQVAEALEPYQEQHPQAEIVLYRQNSVSIRVRVVDPDFRGMTKQRRHTRAWRFLGTLAEETQSDISLLLLLTPDEVAKSLANFEFDDPIPSRF
jgi:stress-induced morphogen